MRWSCLLVAVAVSSTLVSVAPTEVLANKRARAAAEGNPARPRFEDMLARNPRYGDRASLTAGHPAWLGHEQVRPQGSKPADPTHRPVFFAPGNGDDVSRFETLTKMLMKEGYPSGHFYGVSYGEGIRPGRPKLATTLTLLRNGISPRMLARFENAFRAAFHYHYGVPVEQAEPHMKFDMVGQSMGVPILMNMLIKSGLDTRVHRFVNLAGGPNGLDWLPPAEVVRNTSLVGRLLFTKGPVGRTRAVLWDVARLAWNPVLHKTAHKNPLRKIAGEMAPAVSKAEGVARDSDPIRLIAENPLRVHEVVSVRGRNDLMVSAAANRYPHGGRELELRGLPTDHGYMGGDHEISATHPDLAAILLGRK